MTARRTAAVGLVLPVHDEQELLRAALEAVDAAFAHPFVQGLPHVLAIVLDDCHDGSASIARRWSAARDHRAGSGAGRSELVVLVLEREGANVGAARRAGCSAALAALAPVEAARTWIATTDADSQVPPEWLAAQVARHEQGIDLWTGRVTVADWSPRSPRLRHAWRRRYDAEAVPTHGASLGFNAASYLAVGGFQRVRTGEDVRLHRALLGAGAVSCHDRHAPVVTSARHLARAPMGFAHALSLIEAGLQAS